METSVGAEVAPGRPATPSDDGPRRPDPAGAVEGTAGAGAMERQDGSLPRSARAGFGERVLPEVDLPARATAKGAAARDTTASRGTAPVATTSQGRAPGEAEVGAVGGGAPDRRVLGALGPKAERTGGRWLTHEEFVHALRLLAEEPSGVEARAVWSAHVAEAPGLVPAQAWFDGAVREAAASVRLAGGDWTRWGRPRDPRATVAMPGGRRPADQPLEGSSEVPATGSREDELVRRLEPARALPAELAITLAELRRVATAVGELPRTVLTGLRSQGRGLEAPGAELGEDGWSPEAGRAEGEDVETRAAALRDRAAALVVVAGDVFRWHREGVARGARGDAVGLDVDVLARAVADLDTLHRLVSPPPTRRGERTAASATRSSSSSGAAAAGRRTSGAGAPAEQARPPIGLGVIARDAAVLAGRGFLRADDLPDGFQAAYDRAWHTDAKTRTATGGFVGALRDRAAAQGSPALLTVLAASSDGRNRGVAGIAAETPGPVYDKLIYDVSKDVLLDVVQSPQFTQAHAYAMLETKLAAQTAAVMLEGRVDMGIRVLATRQAIAHEGVRPNDVLTFLIRQARNPEVPDALWRDFVVELKRRVYMARLHGNEKERAVIEECAESTTRQFLHEVLRSYWDASRTVQESDRQMNSEGAVQGAGALPGESGKVRDAREYLKAHQFLEDPQILDVMVEGARRPDDLVAMLRYCVESGLPVSNKLVFQVFGHPDAKVRDEGMRLMPNMDDAAVEALRGKVDAEVAADYAAVKDRVFSHVIPADYEGIEGEARKLSRMHHYFRAAKVVPAEDLVQVYVTAAEADPRTIPEAMAYATSMMRYTGRVTGFARGRRGDASGEAGGAEPEFPAEVPVRYQQADLFAAPEGLETPSVGDASPTARTTPSREIRR